MANRGIHIRGRKEREKKRHHTNPYPNQSIEMALRCLIIVSDNLNPKSFVHIFNL